tara:strand:+ start:780 stop:1130 length:351 start_codon:yes stop_codon:yes gene_type:complete
MSNGRVSIEDWNKMVEQGTIVDYKSVKWGDVVKSFDFRWDIGNYYLGRVWNIGPAPENVCPCGGNHLHIAVEKRFVNGEEVHSNNKVIFPACVEHDLGGAMIQIVERYGYPVSPTD